MDNYGKVAVLTSQIYTTQRNITPKDAWNKAISVQNISDKTCARTAFLGLAEVVIL